MNKFIVFRLLLSIIAEREKLTYDGKSISRVAALILNAASESEKKGYAQIAQELKQMHNQIYPNYTEKRRRRNPVYNSFISYNPYKQECDIPPTPQVNAELGPVNVVPEGQKGLTFVPTFQYQPNGLMYSMYN